MGIEESDQSVLFGGDELSEFSPLLTVSGVLILRLISLNLSLEGINLVLFGSAHFNLNAPLL